MLLVRSYKGDVRAAAEHLHWPAMKVQAAVRYAEAFPDEINDAISENSSTDFAALTRMLPHAVDFKAGTVATSRAGHRKARKPKR